MFDCGLLFVRERTVFLLTIKVSNNKSVAVLDEFMKNVIKEHDK